MIISHLSLLEVENFIFYFFISWKIKFGEYIYVFIL